MKYQTQNSMQTLAEGLAEYYEANPTFQFGEFLGMQRDVVTAHDVAHVVFGCGSTSADELVVETWTAFGCTIPPRKIVQVLGDGFVGNLTRTFKIHRMVRRLFLTSPRVLRALWAAKRVKKKWPHFAYDQFWQMPLHDIRRDFGIRVV